MPSVKPANYKSRSGLNSDPVFDYQVTWYKCPFETYDGTTQQQFQDAIGPYARHGAKVPIPSAKGWTRVEGSHPGKHWYIHKATGTIAPFPQEIYDTKTESWNTADGKPITAAELAMNPVERGYRVLPKGPKPVPIPQSKEQAPALPPKPSKAPKAAEAAPAQEVAPAAPKEEKEAPAPAVEEVAKAEEPAKPLEPSLPVGLLFPGQGSQYVKMMSGVKDIPEVQELVKVANEVLGYDILEICLKGPESKLEKTEYCQPAMYLGGMAGVEKLRKDKPDRVERCQAVAGLSLGEYTALTVAGVFDFRTGMEIVKLRGEAMQEAAEASKQSMLSVAGLSRETLENLCNEAKTNPDDVCQIANFLFPNGFSCAGTAAAVEKLMQKAQKTQGCLQAKLLKTSGGFHTSLMQPARDRLVAKLKEMEPKMKSPRCDVYMNVTGKRITPATPPSEIIPMLGDQVMNCVMWEPAMQEMIADGVDEFYECGPMKQLKAMMKRINPTIFAKTTTVDV